MALTEAGNTRGNGIAILVAAGIVYEIIAANCSSPQTTELNADKRAPTLMKWVHLGAGQAALFIGLAIAFDRSHAAQYLLGGGLAAGMMYGLYGHAKAAGLASDEPGTEQW